MTGLAGLESGVVTPVTTFVCEGRWTDMGKQWPKWCWDHGGHGAESFADAISDSCDIVFYKIGYKFYRMGGEKLQKYARKFGFGADRRHRSARRGIRAGSRCREMEVKLQRKLPRDAALASRRHRQSRHRPR